MNRNNNCMRSQNNRCGVNNGMCGTHNGMSGMNNGMSNMNNRSGMHSGAAELLHDIQALSFAKDEAILYLDTHPNHAQALEYFYDICDKLTKLVEKYEAEYGPLTAGGVHGESWSWIEGPWPWQNGTEGKGSCPRGCGEV